MASRSSPSRAETRSPRVCRTSRRRSSRRRRRQAACWEDCYVARDNHGGNAMSLRERLAVQAPAGVALLRPEARIGSSAYQELKVSIHQKLLDRVDLSVMESLAEERLREEIA